MFQEDRAAEHLFIEIQIKKKLLQLSLHIDKNRREILPERSRAHVHIKKNISRLIVKYTDWELDQKISISLKSVCSIKSQLAVGYLRSA